MGIYSILEAFDDSSCFHYFIRKTMNQVSTKNTNKNKRSIHLNVCTRSIPVFIVNFANFVHSRYTTRTSLLQNEIDSVINVGLYNIIYDL